MAAVEMTPLRRVCVHWAALGKSTFDTAKILGCEVGVVRYEMERALLSMNCVRTAQMTAKAVAQGWVDIETLPADVKVRKVVKHRLPRGARKQGECR
jgi:DNA-binding CsgD family transcriptional regulator